MQSQPNPADSLPEDHEQRPTLVRELLCAAIHSRAAYGYAMAAGHMSNLLNFALMHTVHQIRYCIAQQVDTDCAKFLAVGCYLAVPRCYECSHTLSCCHSRVLSLLPWALLCSAHSLYYQYAHIWHTVNVLPAQQHTQWTSSACKSSL